MTRKRHRVLLPLLCLALLAGGSLAQMAVTATPASAATVNSVVLASSPPSVKGEPVTYSVTLTGSSGTPTGTVDILDDTTAICEDLPLGLVVSGVAATECDVSTLAVGSHPLTAVYSGDGVYDAKPSPIMTQTVFKASTTTTAVPTGATTDPAPFSAPVTYSATVTVAAPGAGAPGGTVQFMDGATIISGCETAPVASGVASCEASGMAVAAHTITTTYSGDDGYLTSNDTLSQSIVMADTATVLTSSNPSTTANEAVTYTATISPTPPATASPDAGTVSFLADGAPITGCTAQSVSGGIAACATTSEPVGAPTITAVFNGTEDFVGSIATGITQNVANADTTTALTVDPTPGPYTYGQNLTFTATVSPVSPASALPDVGTVSFTADGTPIVDCESQAVTNGAASCETDALPAGTPSVTAAYTGATGFNSSVASPVGFLVAPAESSTEVTSDINPSVSSQPVQLRATVSSDAGTPTGAIEFRSNGSTITDCAEQPMTAGVATCTTDATPVGAATITAVFTPVDSFRASTSSDFSQVVTKATATNVLTSNNPTAVFGEPVILTATLAQVAPATILPTSGTVSFNDNGSAISTCAARPVNAGVATCTTSTLRVGAHPVTAIAAATTDFESSASTPLTQTVNRVATHTALTPMDTPSRFGKRVRFLVNVTSIGSGHGTPTGVVALYRVRTNGSREWIGRVVLRNGPGTITVSGIPIGRYLIVAQYRGIVGYSSSHRSARQRIDR